MDKLKFIHAADIHLGRPFSGLKRSHPELAGLFRMAAYQAWDRLVSSAIELKVDFVTLGGDTFDSSIPSVRAQTAFRKGVERLFSAGIPVFMVLGNHDPLMKFPSTLHSLPGLHIFKEQTESKPLNSIQFTQGVVILGSSFPRSEVTENLARKFQRDSGIDLAIGLLHANVAGIGGHKDYAPCSVDDLIVSGMDVWCLGHIHSGRILRNDPLVVYSGAVQGSHINEQGLKGCYLISLNSLGDTETQFIPLGPVVWNILRIDVSHISGLDDLMNLVEEKCSEVPENHELKAQVIRIELKGNPNTSIAETMLGDAEDMLMERLADLPVPVFVDSIHDLTDDGTELEQFSREEGFLADYLRLCDSLKTDKTSISDMSNKIFEDLTRMIHPRYIGEQIDPRRLNTDTSLLDETMHRVAWKIIQLFSSSHGKNNGNL